ncbi:polymorphic toxin-type HINT domain-containing protein [uncultured Shimia sp.]|uniref:Hint domain-containing protein n=1 Tax=uncultured Shimia sp. TaxID=573152 RepID=UPI0025EA382D|nr:polymorphic toxin-type HINT domain-containing protein [uncultured Shimia sp.]
MHDTFGRLKMPSLSALLQKLLLSLTFALFANTASAMFIQPDWLDPTEPGVGTNRYSYSFNDPVNFKDPGGNIAESIWDVASASIGYNSAYNNFSNGNVGAGFLDLGGAFLDTLAVAAPGVPGGVSAGIQSWRGLGRAKRSPCNSFAGHTLIQTKDGLVPIEAVAPGDLVFSREEYGTAQAYNRVLTVFKNEHVSFFKLTVSFDDEHQEIEVTDEHPFFVVDKGWRQAAPFSDQGTSLRQQQAKRAE